MTNDDISKLYTLQILPAEIRKDPAGAAYIAVEVQAMQIGGDKGLRAFYSTMDEFMNRLGPMLCLDAFRWRQIENLLNQQGIVSVAGSDAELAFTEGELSELGLEEADALRAAWDAAKSRLGGIPARRVGLTTAYHFTRFKHGWDKSLETKQLYLGVTNADKLQPNVDRAFADWHMEPMRREQEAFFSKAGLRHRWPEYHCTVTALIKT